MKCSCKKSKCLKMYCECFAKGLICGPDCGCQDCCNNDDSEALIKNAKEEILARNPHAFDSKVVEKTGVGLQ